MNRSEAAKRRERHKFLRAHGWLRWNDLLWYRQADPRQRTYFEETAIRSAKREASGQPFHREFGRWV